MTDSQFKISQARLKLGISNVGVWVLASAGGLFWLAPSRALSIGPIHLLEILVAAVALQSFFDFIGGAVLMPEPRPTIGRFLKTWIRGVLAHSALLVAVGVASYYSYRLTGGFALAVLAGSFGLILARREVLRLMTGIRAKPSTVNGAACWSADSRDPSFTGGLCGLGGRASVLLPESWKAQITAAQLEAVVYRRLWEVERNIPLRSYLFVLLWNLAGCRIGSVLLDLSWRTVEHAILLQSCWMTLWGFLALLLLPTLSRSSVFAADRAMKLKGCDPKSWIIQFPQITGEDGNSKTALQRIFYPIPSSAERLQQLENPVSLPILGNVARTNLFVSMCTLSLLGRSVHCNVGRPELWAFPPSD
ncbi:MAG: hypothetical protein WCL08_01175 [Verrucomicrobiota bacterium]